MSETLEGLDLDVKQLARFAIKAIHPDFLKGAIALDQYASLAPQITELTTLLDRALKHPRHEENWGPEINRKYPAGSTISIFGLSGGENPVFRPPVEIALRAPKDFLRIFYKYLKTGDISEDLPPPYNPVTAPAVAGDQIDIEEVDLDDDDPDAPWNVAGAEAELDEAVQSLLNSIRKAPDYGQCIALRLATRLYAQTNMRAFGVLKAMDEKAASFIRSEIQEADSDEKLQVAEEHTREFDFDDEEYRDQLKKELEARRETEGVSHPLPNKYEQLAASARSIDELVDRLKDIEAGTFASADEKNRTYRSVNGYARKMFTEEAGRSASIESLRNIYERAQRFPFTDNEYGFNVLNAIETRAKYLLFNQALASRSLRDLEAIEDSMQRFPFWSEENRLFLSTVVGRRKQNVRLTPNTRG